VWPSGLTPADDVSLDIEVDDLAVAGAHAVASAPSWPKFQPQDDVQVYMDPAGHPFCCGYALLKRDTRTFRREQTTPTDTLRSEML